MDEQKKENNFLAKRLKGLTDKIEKVQSNKDLESERQRNNYTIILVVATLLLLYIFFSAWETHSVVEMIMTTKDEQVANTLIATYLENISQEKQTIYLILSSVISGLFGYHVSNKQNPSQAES